MEPLTLYAPIAGAPGYLVGSDGSVWSFWSKGGRGREPAIGSTPRRLKPDVRRYGHQYITLKTPEGQSRRQVHHLVLEAFVGPAPAGHEACHGNGDASDNALSNLRWGTHAENMADRSKHGTLTGEKHGRAKLTHDLVARIRDEHSSGVAIATLARVFGVSRSQVGRVVRGEHWREAA